VQDILRKAKVFEFLFGQFNFVDEDVDEAIFNYDVEAIDLRIFGKRTHFTLIWL